MKKIKAVFQEKSGFQWLFLTILTMGLGYGIYKGVIDNYLANIVVMGEFERGLAEFFRELPGLLLVLLLALFYTLSAESLYKIGALIMLAGMGMFPGLGDRPEEQGGDPGGVPVHDRHGHRDL